MDWVGEVKSRKWTDNLTQVDDVLISQRTVKLM